MEENAIENKSSTIPHRQVRKDVLEESQHGGGNHVIKKENTSEGKYLQLTVHENIVVKEELAIDESDISTSIENNIVVMDSNATPSDISTEIKEEFIFCESTSASNTVFMEELFLEMSCQKHFIDEELDDKHETKMATTGKQKGRTFFKS